MTQQIELVGRTEYKLNTMLHRSNGPAREWTHTKDWGWYLFDEYHRYYGPRCSWVSNGWYLHGDRIK